MKRTQLISAFLSLAALWGVQTGSAAAQSAANAKPAYLDAGRPIEERVEDALARMTLEEKRPFTQNKSGGFHVFHRRWQFLQNP